MLEKSNLLMFIYTGVFMFLEVYSFCILVHTAMLCEGIVAFLHNRYGYILTF